MLPDPLHPAIVHFPVVLATLLPLFAGGSLWAIRRGFEPRRAWFLPVLMAGALAVSAFVAVRTGQAQEDRVEDIVPRDALHDHEEAAERFLIFSGVLFVIAGLGLTRGRLASASRITATVGSALLVAAAIQVSHLGGHLVYRYNAGSAYTDDSAARERTGERRGGSD